MIVWGTLTHWKFKRDNYEKLKVLKLLQQGIEDRSEYQNVGNQLSDYFFNTKKMESSQKWCFFYCREEKYFNDSSTRTTNNTTGCISRFSS